MKKLLLLLVVSSLCWNAWSQDKYYGARSTEAVLRFEGVIEVATERAFSLEQANSQSAKAQELKALVDEQLSFLIGHFQSESFLQSFRFPGVLGDKYQYRFKSVLPRFGETQKLIYQFEGKTVFHSAAFNGSDIINLPLRLPLNPRTLFKKGLVGRINRCTDEHYNTAGDFFYFWDPDKAGCPLQGNNTDVLRLTGKLQRLPNTNSTYPEYNQLYHLPVLELSIFLGYIDDEPMRSRTQDDGYRTLRELIRYLKAEGFVVTMEQHERTLNYFLKLEKNHRNQLGSSQKVVVNLLLSDSSTGVRDNTFTKLFAEALSKSSIVAYDGHSGLGGNLDFERFNLRQLPAFYQIFFFNGCSSYPYFNSMYFERKPGGKRNLEIITAGLPTLTSTSTSNMVAFIAPFVAGRIHSYQTILQSLERSNGEEASYLMGVNGDEDNKFRPAGR